MPCLLTETVLETIKKTPRTANQLADLFKVDKKLIYRHAHVLLKQGLIISTSHPGGKVYSVLTPSSILE